MSYSMDPLELVGLADRVRRTFDDVDEVAAALHRAVDAVARALARVGHVRTAFAEVADGRVELAHRIVARGRAAVSAVQTAVLAYLTADDEMARQTEAASSSLRNPFDPLAFGRRVG